MQYNVLSTILAALLVVPAGAQAPPCAEEAGFAALDFWVGDWTVWAGGSEVGRNRIVKVQDGCAIEEHWVGAQGGTGQSLFYYLPVEGSWRQVWVTPNARVPGGVKEKQQVEAPAGSMRFQGSISRPAEAPYLDRTTLTPLEGGTVRQHIEVSTDDGATWRTTFDAEYRPVGSGSDEAGNGALSADSDSTPSPRGARAQQSLDVSTRYMELDFAGDLRAVRAMYADEMVFHDPTADAFGEMAIDEPVRGADAVLELQKSWGIEEIEFERRRGFAVGEYAVHDGMLDVRFADAPAAVRFPAVFVHRVRDGRILERTDFGKYLESFGLGESLPFPGSRTRTLPSLSTARPPSGLLSSPGPSPGPPIVRMYRPVAS